MKVGTKFPVATTAEMFPVVVLGIDDPVRPREKMAPDGSLTYSSGCLLKTERADGSVSTDKSASIHVLKPQDSYEGLHQAKGRVWVQPWTSDSGRLAYSITVDELVPLGSTPASAAAPAPARTAAPANPANAVAPARREGGQR